MMLLLTVLMYQLIMEINAQLPTTFNQNQASWPANNPCAIMPCTMGNMAWNGVSPMRFPRGSLGRIRSPFNTRMFGSSNFGSGNPSLFQSPLPNMLTRNMMANNMVPNNMMLSNLIPNNMMMNNVVPNNMMPNGMMPNGMMPNNMMPNNMMPNSMSNNMMTNNMVTLVIRNNNGRSMTVSVPIACMQTRAKGGCANFVRRYYFNRFTGHCEEFTYSGCGGNNNNFASILQCQQLCVVPNVG
ncbi:uncharacterized protein LOC121371524 [Gigantopelta aegis]|uniref:uncharacterized protein LOC121371524 n=1 Tax=Gigantopelta aegis TaxID=1735272 RepID=UPI001B8892D2|nr:uncharacterized protein LOC121371524 [Gigantopelta aegis]